MSGDCRAEGLQGWKDRAMSSDHHGAQAGEIPGSTRTEIHQFPARPHAPQLTLIPPLADPEHDLSFEEPPIGFGVCGPKDTAGRARQWALENRYLLAEGISPCAHGLYMMGCPSSGCSSFGFDHTQIWVPADVPGGRPFILTSPYTSEVPGRLRVYAEAHGLELSVDGHLRGGELHEERHVWEDNWYYPGHALPIRLTVPVDWPMWPIEEQAFVLLATQPVEWPG